MAPQDTSRRLPPKTLSHDIDSYNGLQTIPSFTTDRPDASAEAVQKAYEIMLAKQADETAKEAVYKAAADAARLAEWYFHNTVLAMKEAVKGKYGSDSDQAAAVGFKKKSERKRPTRSKKDE